MFWRPLYIVWILAGCSQTEPLSAPGRDALERIGNILGVAPTEIHVLSRTAPTVAAPEFSETRIALTDALALGDCGLVPLIAERNSALGRQKAESTRFLYEWRIWSGLTACHDQLADEAWFLEAVAGKRADVEIAIEALLTRGDEAQALQSALASPYPDLKSSADAYATAWADIAPLLLRALTGNAPPTDAEFQRFELALKQWGMTQHHAELGRAIRESAAWLLSANQMLDVAITENRLCPMGMATAEGHQAATFVQTYFANTIQQQIATVMQSTARLNRLWEPLRDASPRLAKHLMTEDLLRLPSGMSVALEARWATHIEKWQTLLRQCQLAPRAATTNS